MCLSCDCAVSANACGREIFVYLGGRAKEPIDMELSSDESVDSDSDVEIIDVTASAN